MGSDASNATMRSASLIGAAPDWNNICPSCFTTHGQMDKFGFPILFGADYGRKKDAFIRQLINELIAQHNAKVKKSSSVEEFISNGGVVRRR
jgi:hypothetical protein